MLEARRAESGVEFLGRGSQPHQLGGLEERCKLPQRGPGFSRILNTQDGLSGQQDYGPRRFYFFWLPGPVVGPEVGPVAVLRWARGAQPPKSCPAPSPKFLDTVVLLLVELIGSIIYSNFT